MHWGKRIPEVSAWTRDHAETAQQWFQVACIASARRPQGNTPQQSAYDETTAGQRCLRFCAAQSQPRFHLTKLHLWTTASFPSSDNLAGGGMRIFTNSFCGPRIFDEDGQVQQVTRKPESLWGIYRPPKSKLSFRNAMSLMK